MKIIIEREFNFDMGDGMVCHCTPHPDPATVKRSVGEHGVAIGAAKEVGARKASKSKTQAAKAAKAPGNDDTGQVGGAPTGQARTGRSDTSTTADVDRDDDGDSAAGAGLDGSG